VGKNKFDLNFDMFIGWTRNRWGLCTDNSGTRI